MSKRKAVSKKIRFEVFKRDKFTCRYCGKKPPEIILHLDHIDPVSKGGGNEIVNLITSCRDCNLGKSDRKLSDDSVLEKQHQQMSELQERREQIEMMFKWRKGLDQIEDETAQMLRDYIESKIDGYTLNEKGERDLQTLLKRFDLTDILDAIDLSAANYLKWDDNQQLEKKSVDNFITKIGGICHNKKKSPVDQKISYVMGIGRNRFHYWNDRNGAIRIKEYLDVLRNDCDYSDDDILEDFEADLIPMTKNARNWSQWSNTLENWKDELRGNEIKGAPAPISPQPSHTNSEPEHGSKQRVDLSEEQVKLLTDRLFDIPDELIQFVRPFTAVFGKMKDAQIVKEVRWAIFGALQDVLVYCEWMEEPGENDLDPLEPSDGISQSLWQRLDLFGAQREKYETLTGRYALDALVAVISRHFHNQQFIQHGYEQFSYASADKIATAFYDRFLSE